VRTGQPPGSCCRWCTALFMASNSNDYTSFKDSSVGEILFLFLQVIDTVPIASRFPLLSLHWIKKRHNERHYFWYGGHA
jgi:hypothetical protein